MASNDRAAQAATGIPLTAAPHRTMFFTGATILLVSSLWWTLHLAARYTGVPLFALDLGVAPIWAHTFIMLFVAFPSFFFGFLFTTFPRWMNGPQVPRGAYVATAVLFGLAAVAWLVGIHASAPLRLVAVASAFAALATGLAALFRVLVDAEQTVSHAVVVCIAFAVGCVTEAGFAWGIWTSNDFALHFAVRSALWGFLLPVFFAVCHRMVPFFSQSAIAGYVAWRPRWLLVSVIALVYARLVLGTAGDLSWLVTVDLALALLTATCAIRWTSLGARGNPLLWTLYVAYAWMPVAMLLQALRDGSFAVTGQWALGLAPIHALGIGCFGGLLVAMMTRVTMGHSGRPLRMDRWALACFLAVQAAAVCRVGSEIVRAPSAIRDLLLASALAWLLAFAVWTGRHAGIFLTPRADGRPG